MERGRAIDLRYNRVISRIINRERRLARFQAVWDCLGVVAVLVFLLGVCVVGGLAGGVVR